MNAECVIQDHLPPLGLTWGVKRSFISYLTRLPDGAVSAADGANVVASSLFNFAPDSSDYGPSSSTGTLRFSGDVRMAGHQGMMFVRLLDPWIEFRVDEAELSVSTTNDDGSGLQRIVLGTMRPIAPQSAPGALVWQGVDVALTEAGSEVFNQQYPAGQELDPLFIRIVA
ncbi:HtaA domain-containing protein [Arthrobacter sp. GCM10027362]|uniref:HtaA domain-containing protein n=1 Tax=Arthrobacter sp. GCM10027362 TaxID=3273379 RepID=UPI0036321DE4